MDSSSDLASTIPFKSKKPPLSTPIKNTTTTTTDLKSNAPASAVPTAVATPDRVNPKPTTRARNKNYALTISDVRRMAQQLQKPGVVGSDPPKVVPEEKLGSGVAQKSKGSENAAENLPEKYETTSKFFNAMVSSIQLLRMKRMPPTFSKLARSVESLTDRRFTLHHLAQLKYVVPEVIVLKKIRVQDEETKCMKEDIHVSLETDVVETNKNAKGGVKFSQLKELFLSRIVDFSKSHQENDDVPEGELPQLFYKPKQETEPNMNKAPAPMAASLTAPSFKKRFSSRALGASLVESSPSKLSSSCLSETLTKEPASPEADASPLDVALTPVKPASVPTKFASTPAEFASSPARLMAATPSLRTPKRTRMTPDHDTCDLPNKSAKRRSLNFDETSDDIDNPLTKVDEEESIVPVPGSLVSKDDVLGVLPEVLLQSLMEKEKQILMEKDPIVVEAKSRQKLMAGVPKLFDMIHLLFQSIGRAVFTKEELIYKLVGGHMDVVDKYEIEEQLKLLQEVAPESISEQVSLSGDTLLRLNKFSSAESIRAKLLTAK